MKERIDKYRYKDESGKVCYYINDQWKHAQEKWLETNDEKYLWEMFPGYLHATKSCMIKRLKGQWIPNFNEKAEAACLYQLEYHKKHPTTKIDDVMKWSSFLCMRALYSKESKQSDKDFYEVSYDDIVESTGNDLIYDTFEDDIIEQLSKEGY